MKWNPGSKWRAIPHGRDSTPFTCCPIPGLRCVTIPRFRSAPSRLRVPGYARYIEANAPFIPNYGERWRNADIIASGFVESTVNEVVSKRMVKKQQMQWTKRGAHLLLQART